MFLVLRVILVAKDIYPGKANIVAESAVGSRDKSKNGGARDFIPRRKVIARHPYSISPIMESEGSTSAPKLRAVREVQSG